VVNGGTGTTTPALVAGTNVSITGSWPNQTINSTAAGGDVVGPASATDNALARFDTTTGELIQNSVAILDDSGNLTGIAALTTSGAVTLSGGTANGVAYLNGSKVLTTGSALTFDGTKLTNTGSAGGVRLEIVSTSSSPEISLTSADTGTSQINFGGATTPKKGVFRYSDNSDLFVWLLNSTAEQMRLTSTGLGIGTSSVPSYAGYKTLAINGTSGGEIDFLDGGTTRGQIYSASTGMTFTTLGAIPLYLGTNGTTRATLDSSGNLGLGVTPSAQGATYRAINLSSSASYFSIAGQGAGACEGNLLWNARTTGTEAFAYMNTGDLASRFRQSGQFSWHTAPSGTAGNAISFTQAMTLDASGNLGVGTTSPLLTAAGRGNITVNGSTDAIFVLGNAGAYAGYLYAASTKLEIDAQGSRFMQFNTNGTERARIDSSGDLLVGRTSATGVSRVGIAGNSDNTTGINLSYTGVGEGLIRVVSSSALTFGYDVSNGATERMRIDSSGNLLVGTTSQPISGITTRLAVTQSVADYSQVLNNTNATPYGIYIKHDTDSNGTGNAFIVAIGNAADRFVVRSNGGIANYSANDVNLSDRREKTNFAPAKSYLETICAIPVQTFNYIDQNMEDDPGLTLGVVAQDVQAVAPELVMESNWGSKDDPKMRLSIYQTDLQYALMKCIQEQQAIINSLKARLDAANL
jgi:hypothetical protein